MEEQLISFNTAKLAKEKGFNIHCPCYCYYDDNTTKITVQRASHWRGENFNKWFDTEKVKTASLPTQSLLQKWLREVHNIIVEPCVFDKGFLEKGKFCYQYYMYNNIFDPEISIDEWKTYEEALEAGLFYALTMINDKNV